MLPLFHLVIPLYHIFIQKSIVFVKKIFYLFFLNLLTFSTLYGILYMSSKEKDRKRGIYEKVHL
jgi:hypothetical protein